jgi:membrane protein YqaA with SNARE-associated domain
VPYLATFGLAFVSGLVPFVNAEAGLISYSLLASGPNALLVVLAATLGQMTAKTLIFLSGRGVLRLPWQRGRANLDAVAAKIGRGRSLFLFLSASLGLPPFYVVSLAAGVLKVPLGVFLATGLSGRFLRFAFVFYLPRALQRFAS